MMRRLLILALALAAAALIAVATDLAVPVVVLMLPGLITLLIDRTPGLSLARAMLVFQGVVAVGPVQNAYYACSGMRDCMDRICQPRIVLAAWLAAGVAWALSEMVPIGLRLLDDVRLRSRRQELQKQRADLAAEWGITAPAGGSQAPARR